MNFWTRPAWKWPGSRVMRRTSLEAAEAERVAHIAKRQMAEETRNPKPEGRNKSETQNPKAEGRGARDEGMIRLGDFACIRWSGFGALGVFMPSSGLLPCRRGHAG